MTIAAFLFVFEWPPGSTAQDRPDERRRVGEQGPELIVYSGEFDGRSLRVRSTLLDMPEEETPEGETYDWNDRVSSIVVVRGTWRLFENGRRNTELDETPLEALDVSSKEAVGGWSCVVSAGPGGPVRVTARDGLFADDEISSIELVSDRALPDAAARRGPAGAPEIEVFWDIDFEGRSLVIRGSAPELPAVITETGEELSWDENISSVVVRGGTWRLCEASDFNRVSGGWSTLVSAGMHGELRQSASECGGWTNDSISSIQLVSEGGMEDWAVLNREARRRR
jgi:hypothetical protein